MAPVSEQADAPYLRCLVGTACCGGERCPGWRRVTGHHHPTRWQHRAGADQEALVVAPDARCIAGSRCLRGAPNVRMVRSVARRAARSGGADEVEPYSAVLEFRDPATL